MVIMPKLTIEVCPQCLCTVESSESRLIHDTCGHKKCRLCLMKEELGCVACKTKFIESDDNTSRKSCKQKNPNFVKDNSTDVSLLVTLDHGIQFNTRGNSIDVTDTEKNKSSEKSVSKPGRKKFAIESHITTLPGIPKKYQCTICDKICSTKMSLRYHNYCASKPKPFTCETCGKGFVTKSHYEYHIKIHTGALPYICDVCAKGFKDKGKLSRHIKSHSDDRPFICQECGKTYSSVESLKSHQRTHTGEKPHVCHLCTKAFTEHSNYMKHISFHKGEKLHMCDICGKTFSMKRSLVTHTLMIHDRQRNHMCNICNRKFTLKRDLKRHEMVHSVVRPHSCTLCNIGFRRKDNLERHMKNTHPETRMVVIGSIKQKSTEENKSTPKLVQQRSKENSGDIDENAGDIDENSVDDPATPLPPSPIPPSQTISIEKLHSVQKISNAETKITNTGRTNICSENNSIPQHTELANTTNYLHPDNQVNCDLVNNNIPMTQETQPVQMSDQCYENMHNMQKVTDVSETSFVIHQETNQSVAHMIYPPKKNIEYYRAVPVINRSTHVTNNCTSDTCHTVSASNEQEIGRRVEGTNCVPTITRACDYMPGSVITRNVQQNSTTVLKAVSRDDNYQTLNSLPCAARESHSDQPSLRKLLHDVKCSNGSDIMNLESDIEMSKSNLFSGDLKQLDSIKFDKPNIIEAQFYPSKLQDTYLAETSVQNRGNEYPSCSNEHYLSNDYSRKASGAETETLYSDTQFRQNYNQFNYDLIPPPYMGYESSIGSLPRYPDVAPTPDLISKYSTDLHRSNMENYVYAERPFHSADRLKPFPDVLHLEGSSCSQGIGRPVIVGTRKVSNNVICSSFVN